MTISESIQRSIKPLGWTVWELSERTGISYSTLSDFVNGGSTSYDNVLLIAIAVGEATGKPASEVMALFTSSMESCLAEIASGQ